MVATTHPRWLFTPVGWMTYTFAIGMNAFGERTGNSSLYHKERPPVRPRLAPDPMALPDDSSPSPPRRRGRSPGFTLLMRNLRVLAIFIAGMLLVLAGSIAILRIIWSIRDREFASPPAPERLLPPAPKTARAPDPPSTAPTTEPGLVASAELDTERIRRAVFLARHAQSLEENGLLQEAITRYREALDVWPHLSAAWAQLGRAHLKAREFAKAQLALERAVQSNPATAELMNDLGAALLYQGQTQRAAKLFEAAMDIDPDFAPSYFNLALTQLALNDHVAARANLQKFLRLRPRDARALREIAFLDALEGQYESALAALDRALAEAPDWPLLYFDYAAVSALMGLMEQAIAFLQKAEPLTSPRVVFQIYREPAFREIRLTELGKSFEHELAQRARERLGEELGQVNIQPPTEPILSVESGSRAREAR